MTTVPRTARLGTGRWVVDPARSTATFSVRNFGLRTVRGAVPVIAGAVEVDDDGCPLRVHAELDLAALDTGNRRRDTDLRKPALLDLDACPVMTYDAGSFELGPQGWVARGTLAARGATCPLAVLGVPAATGRGIHVVGTAVLDRTDLGVRSPRLLIGRAVSVVVDTWLARE